MRYIDLTFDAVVGMEYYKPLGNCSYELRGRLPGVDLETAETLHVDKEAMGGFGVVTE